MGAGLLALLLAGCATSNDPREGGLIGYLRHGEAGYQERLNQREGELESVEREAAAARTEAERLRERRDEVRTELARQREALEALHLDVEAIRAACAAPGSGSPEAQAEQRRLTESTDGIAQQIQDLEQDTGMLVRDRERRIAELSRELKLLREQASLLTAL